MDKQRFADLEVGDRFLFNHMYYEKQKPRQVSIDDNRSIMANAHFLSDTHYERGLTEYWVSGGPIHIEDHVMVVPHNQQLKADTR